MTDNLYETYIANQASLTSFEKTALKVLVRNEVSNSSVKAFQIMPPVTNNSGYSFGPLQFDLKSSDKFTIFVDALMATPGVFATRGDAEAIASRLVGKKGYANGNLLTASETAKINQALSSVEGTTFLIEKSIEKVRTTIGKVEGVIADARADIQALFQNDTLKLALIDYDNRFNMLPLGDPNAKMAQFLADGQTTLEGNTVQFIPNDPWASIERFQLATKEAAKIETWPDGSTRYLGAESIGKRLDAIRTEAIQGSLSGTEYLPPPSQRSDASDPALPRRRIGQDTVNRNRTDDALWPAPGSDTTNDHVATATVLHRQSDAESFTLNTNDTDASETLSISISKRLRDEADLLIASADCWRNPEKLNRVAALFQEIERLPSPDANRRPAESGDVISPTPDSDTDATVAPPPGQASTSTPAYDLTLDRDRAVEAGDPTSDLLAEADEMMAADDYWRSRAKQARVAAIFKQLYPGTLRTAPLAFGEGV